MNKLPQKYNFLDISDYARPLARLIASYLAPTSIRAYQVTLVFSGVGIIGVYALLQKQFLIAAFCFQIKNLLDAVDGQLARMQNKPSVFGRYLDSICDWWINLLIVLGIAEVVSFSLEFAAIYFLLIQLQGTVYNYFHVMQRHIVHGQTTSRLNEFSQPNPTPHDHPILVSITHRLYLIHYYVFDVIIEKCVGVISKVPLSNRFLSVVSYLGLGFFLLEVTVLLVLQSISLFPIMILLNTVFGICIIIYYQLYERK
jgi:hypothetical protein